MPRAGKRSKRSKASRPKARRPKPDTRSIEERICDLDLFEKSLARAVLEALQMHKRAGNPVAEWHRGRVRWVQPKDIPDHF